MDDGHLHLGHRAPVHIALHNHSKSCPKSSLFMLIVIFRQIIRVLLISVEIPCFGKMLNPFHTKPTHQARLSASSKTQKPIWPHSVFHTHTDLKFQLNCIELPHLISFGHFQFFYIFKIVSLCNDDIPGGQYRSNIRQLVY